MITEKKTTTIAPFRVVNNGKKAVDFYRSAFGAIELARYDRNGDQLTSKIAIEGA